MRGLPEYREIEAFTKENAVTVVHFINRRRKSHSSAKDYEFSRTTVRELWQAGLDDMRRTCAHRDWLKATEVEYGVRVVDLSRDGR